MECPQCNKVMQGNELFCPNCGMKVLENPKESNKVKNPVAIEKGVQEVEIEKNRPSVMKTKKSVVLSIILPVFAAVFMVAALAVFYFNELKINDEVMELKQKGEQLALGQEYEAAIKKLEAAVKQRPHYKGVQESLVAVRLAFKFDNQLVNAEELVKKQDYAGSEKIVAKVKDGLSSQSGELFAPLVEKADKQAVNLKVILIKKEIEPLNNVKELGEKLSVLNSISSSEGEVVKKQVINKIVEVALADASVQLGQNQFSEAVATVESGLKYAGKSEKLTSYKTKIEQEQSAFEEAERTRIEKALEQAAREDLLNRTAAIEVISIESDVDEYGDLYLYGDMENVSTTNLSSVTIYYTIYDSMGSYVADSFTTLDPYYLDVGETGSFSDLYYGVYDDGATVQIDNITWYLE